MTRLIEKLHSVIQAKRRCSAGLMTPEQWENGHWQEEFNAVMALLPSGSGIDRGTAIDIHNCTDDRIVLVADYHHMDQHGFYDGWTEHKMFIRPTFDSPHFTLRITGKNKNDIKDYLSDTFYQTLSRRVEMQFNIREHGKIQYKFAD